MLKILGLVCLGTYIIATALGISFLLLFLVFSEVTNASLPSAYLSLYTEAT